MNQLHKGRFIILFLLLSGVMFTTVGQTRMVVKGNVFDVVTNDPLPFATIGVKGGVEGTITKSDGSFELWIPVEYANDTLRVTFLGYKPFYKKINDLSSAENIYLEQSVTMLNEVVIVQKKFNTRPIDKDLRLIKDKLYAMETEVTNEQYNLFLADLEDTNPKLFEKCEFDLSGYDKNERAFFIRYATQSSTGKKPKDSVKIIHIAPHETEDYPAINIPYEGALAYCDWLTQQYNSHSGRKKFKKVKFRLPTKQEWQIAALGYTKFQTWVLEDNFVDVLIPKDTTSMMPKNGVRKKIPVGKDILYPWFGSYYYRGSPQNHRNCFMGNFYITQVNSPCKANLTSFDGWSMMARTASYFPNDMGLYDVVGNVAEMVVEKGKACGGSWNDPPSESTIHSVKNYTTPNATVGFRVFMEVIE